MESYAVTDKNKVRRSPSRGSYDQDVVYKILDAGFVCQVGFIADGQPFVIPMSYGRRENVIYLHGASSSRIINQLTSGSICINVTFIDGIVVARSLFDTSVNYRSVVLFGKAEIVEEEEKLEALQIISDYILPGRWEEVRPAYPKELKATSILKVTIESASAKIRTGPPKDDEQDLDLPVWAGEIPLKIQVGTPLDDPALRTTQPIPKSVKSTLEKY